MPFKPGDTVKIKTPISYQWFVAHVLEVSGETIKAKTLFEVKGQDVWVVSASNVIGQFPREDAAMKGSPSLQRELRKVTRAIK